MKPYKAFVRRVYFFGPVDLFLTRSESLLLHFLHLTASMGFLEPQLMQILK